VRRGEIWRYQPVIAREGVSTLRLIVAADVLAGDDRIATVYAAQIVTPDPGRLLAVKIGSHGWAYLLEIERALRSRLVERIGEATEEEMGQVDAALRAVYDI
jgi:mRNA-degrading endonuclease toxin of MazEF toxin-antitoxin module